MLIITTINIIPQQLSKFNELRHTINDTKHHDINRLFVQYYAMFLMTEKPDTLMYPAVPYCNNLLFNQSLAAAASFMAF